MNLNQEKIGPHIYKLSNYMFEYFEKGLFLVVGGGFFAHKIIFLKRNIELSF